MQTSNALPAEKLSFGQIVSHRSLWGHKMSPESPYKGHVRATHNLHLFQIAFPLHPSTSKIQIATPCKNRLSGQFTELSESGHETATAKWNWRSMVKIKAERLQAPPKLVLSQVWMMLLKVKLRLLQDRCEIVEGQKWGWLWAPGHYLCFHVGFPTFKQLRNGETNGYRIPSSQTESLPMECPLFLCPGPWQTRVTPERMYWAFQGALAKWAKGFWKVRTPASAGALPHQEPATYKMFPPDPAKSDCHAVSLHEFPKHNVPISKHVVGGEE